MKTIPAILVVAFAAITAASAQERPNQPTAKPPAVKVLRDLAYVDDGHERHRLDLYLPEKPQGPLPLIVWVHGGAVACRQQDGWHSGHRSDGQGLRSRQHQLPVSASTLSSPPRSRTARRPSAGCGPTRRSTISIRITSASGARRPAATWSPCWARPAASRNWTARAATSTSRAACNASSIGSGRRTCAPWVKASSRTAGGTAHRRPGAEEQGEGP